MWTKSFIQLQVESIQERAKFANDINKLLESYQIPDGVFGVRNNNTYELSTGYFVAVKEFSTIDEAIKEMNQNNQAVRITENKFILGNVYNCLSDAPDNSEVFSIEFLENVK